MIDRCYGCRTSWAKRLAAISQSNQEKTSQKTHIYRIDTVTSISSMLSTIFDRLLQTIEINASIMVLLVILADKTKFIPKCLPLRETPFNRCWWLWNDNWLQLTIKLANLPIIPNSCRRRKHRYFHYCQLHI